MSITKRVAWVLSAAVLASTGCDDVRGDACACGDDEVAAREVQINGINLNGINLNGINLNGVNLNGINLNGINLNGPRLFAPDGSGDFIETMALDLQGNAEAQTVWLDGSRLSVLTTQGQTLTGGSLDKALFEFVLQEGGAVNKKAKGILIRGVSQLAPGSDIWLYDLDVKTGEGGWQPLCTDHNGVPTEAILVGDVWNPATAARVSPRPAGALTFACRDAAIAKCAEFGYKPWASVNGVPLAEHHQACTRMVRADYCGDGQSHTHVGTPIHVLDPLGIQKLDANASFVVEAEWGPNGATCLHTENMRAGALALSCQIPTCSAAFSSGGLIQSGKIVAGP